uniref:Protein kinase domain-containing protein n=1 Tax=Rhizochromulina marina TaxID=1034831 RepID=A0A7S2W3H0_9STRA
MAIGFTPVREIWRCTPHPRTLTGSTACDPTEDEVFIDFVATLLRYDQISRPSALEALRHPFLAETEEALREVEEFETELRGGSDARSDKNAKAGKRPPRRLTSTKGKVVAKPSTPRMNNATKKSRLKPGGSTI